MQTSLYSCKRLEVIALNLPLADRYFTMNQNLKCLYQGLWDNQNPGTLTEEVGEYAEFERHGKFDDDRGTRRGFRRKKSHPKKREAEDDWELPMDYL